MPQIETYTEATALESDDFLAGVKTKGTAPELQLWSRAVLKTYFDTLYSTTTAGGWQSGTGTWSYSSADAPTFIISVNADVTALIGVGDRIKITQSTGGTKYFIVTVVGAFSAGATLVTVYGGTDYTLNDEVISSPYYSHVKHPFGFPASRIKWTVEVTNTSYNTQADPVQNTWYNLGTVSITIPIGLWNVSYAVTSEVVRASNAVSSSVTLSTANNSESDVDFSTYTYGYNDVAVSVYKDKPLLLAAKATYYLNTRTVLASATNLANDNDVNKLFIRAVCLYL